MLWSGDSKKHMGEMIMQPLEIVPYQSEYWAQMMEIHDAARLMELQQAGLIEAFIPLAEAAENENLFEYTLRIALLDGAVVGFVAYSEDELAWLYVNPKQMRKGIGRQLIQYVLDNNSHRPITVEVLMGNAPAIALYESMGFQTMEIASGFMTGNESFAVSAHIMQLT